MVCQRSDLQGLTSSGLREARLLGETGIGVHRVQGGQGAKRLLAVGLCLATRKNYGTGSAKPIRVEKLLSPKTFLDRFWSWWCTLLTIWRCFCARSGSHKVASRCHSWGKGLKSIGWWVLLHGLSQCHSIEAGLGSLFRAPREIRLWPQNHGWTWGVDFIVLESPDGDSSHNHHPQSPLSNLHSKIRSPQDTSLNPHSNSAQSHSPKNQEVPLDAWRETIAPMIRCSRIPKRGRSKCGPTQTWQKEAWARKLVTLKYTNWCKRATPCKNRISCPKGFQCIRG